MTTTQAISEGTPKYKRGMNPNSRKNLKVGGITGNGNLEGYSLAASLKKMLEKPFPATISPNVPAKELLAHSTLQGAILREVTPLNIVWDRVEGKVPGDQPPVTQDNRVLNIIVMDEKTKDLIGKVADRAKKLIEG